MSTATANGIRVLSCTIDLPAQGVWHADVETDGDDVLASPVTLKVADATYVGAIKSGGTRNAQTQAGEGGAGQAGGALGWHAQR